LSDLHNPGIASYLLSTCMERAILDHQPKRRREVQ
jgi:hypothetical protein